MSKLKKKSTLLNFLNANYIKKSFCRHLPNNTTTVIFHTPITTYVMYITLSASKIYSVVDIISYDNVDVFNCVFLHIYIISLLMHHTTTH